MAKSLVPKCGAVFAAAVVTGSSFDPDGIGVLDVRATMELEDGALVYTTYSGVADLGPDGYHKFLEGNPPELVELRITPRYHTGHSDYLWLNRLQCVGVGAVDMKQMKVSYDICAMQ